MSALSELLQRLRRVRPPPGGPATVVSVPSPGDDVTREVAFLFAELDAVDEQAKTVSESARIQADAIEADARAQRAQILAEARQRAEHAFAEVFSEQRATGESQAQAILADAQRAASRVLARGRESTPALAAEVVRRIVGESS